MRTEIREAVARLIPAEQLDIRNAPAVQRVDEVSLVVSASIGQRAEQVALLANAQVVARQPGDVRKAIEQLDAFAHQRDLFGIVELQSKCAGGRRRGEGAQRRSLFEQHHAQSGPAREERGGRADDPAADHHHVRAWRRLGHDVKRGPAGGHRAGVQRPSTATASSPPGQGGIVVITISSGSAPVARN